MARMFAKYFFAALLFLLTTFPCSADQNLEVVSIGGFTWNLGENGLSSPTIQHSVRRANLNQQSEIPWQMANCNFSGAASTVQLPRSIANSAGHQAAAVNVQSFFGPNTFSHPDWLLNAVCPHKRSYVLRTEKIVMHEALPLRRQDFQENMFDRPTIVSMSGVAANVMQVTSDKLSPLVTSFVKGIFQTASFTAQHARFPMESFPVHSVKSVNRRVRSLNSTQRMDTNPLRIAEGLKPALLPIESAANFAMSANKGNVSNSIDGSVVAKKLSGRKMPERMDMYWNYYGDCDRWHVVIGKSMAEHVDTFIAKDRPKSQFAWFGRVIAEAANLDSWLSRAVRQLESQSEAIVRDTQATWKEIEFHLFQAPFAKSTGNPQNVHFSTNMRNPD